MTDPAHAAAATPQSVTSRRNALKFTGAAMLAPFFLRTSNKAGSRNAIVGEGEYQYECLHDWDRGGLPQDHNYGNASHGVTIDAEGLIYITHQGNPGSIFVFEPGGRFVRAMGEAHNRGSGKGHGIDIRREGSQEFLYLSPSDSAMAFTKMTLDGEIVWQKDRAAINRDTDGLLDRVKRYRPTNTSFRADGGYYLGDGYGSNYLFEYDKNDRFVRAIGGAGMESGRFQTPHGQWLDERSDAARLIVADRANKRLQWFNSDGSHAATQDGFLFPADIDIQGDLVLVPDLHARVTILNGKNEPVAQLGDDEEWRAAVLADRMKMRTQRDRWQPGRFVHPHDACFDKEGNIFVAEWVRTGRVTKLVRIS